MVGIQSTHCTLMFARHGGLQGKMPRCVSITATHDSVHARLDAAEERGLAGFPLPFSEKIELLMKVQRQDTLLSSQMYVRKQGILKSCLFYRSEKKQLLFYFILIIRKHFSESTVKHWNRLPSKVMEHHPWRFKKHVDVALRAMD